MACGEFRTGRDPVRQRGHRGAAAQSPHSVAQSLGIRHARQPHAIEPGQRSTEGERLLGIDEHVHHQGLDPGVGKACLVEKHLMQGPLFRRRVHPPCGANCSRPWGLAQFARRRAASAGPPRSG